MLTAKPQQQRYESFPARRGSVMQLDGSSLTSPGVYRLRWWATFTKVRTSFEGRAEGRRGRSRPSRNPHGPVVPANITAVVRLKHVFELLERLLNVGGEMLGMRFSSNGDSHDGEEATPPVQQELGLDHQIDFRVVLLGAIRPLSPAIRDDVYRIGREALENALHHSGASRIEVEFEYAARRFRMVVRDNGRGIDPLAPDFRARERSGLRAMAELAATIG